MTTGQRTARAALRDQVTAIRRISTRAVGATTDIHIEPAPGPDAIAQIMTPSHRAQQQVRRALHRVGWQLAQGPHRLMIVQGWSRAALTERAHLLDLACADARRTHPHTIRSAITMTEAHLQTGNPGRESELVAHVCEAVDARLPWPDLIDEVNGVPRTSTDPAIIAALDAVREAETTLALLIAEHLLLARRTVEVLWRCHHAQPDAPSPAVARMAAEQEALRLIRSTRPDVPAPASA
ncbi:hypothetical protein PS9374_04444 [Planomonospora sphaerica]|uniref:Uncharacterized protein n=1 Tax=Planomonospora sphaerica TaxID=161355 RepID=A0A171DIR7_9ACTN|nr:hypothetical protein [Planomonospora sphaerica]GAT68779.1 hypothetical protein PS9374_04444 [Planomonospora sphaerica]